MAYKLKFTGATAIATIAERVDLASSITLNANTGTNSLRVEIEFELDSLSATNTLLFAANFCRFQIFNTGQISVQYRNQTNSLAAVTSATGVISTGVRYVLALELSNVDRNARIFLDGVQVGVAASRWGTFTLDRVGLWPENTTFNGSIYRLTCYQNNVIVNDYDPSASNGTGSTLIDTTGGNNGTLVNFPTNNSQWVFYESGGGTEFTATISSTTLLPTSSVAITNLKPEYAATIASNALLPSGSVALESIAPAYNVTITSSAFVPTSFIVLDDLKPEYSALINSNTILPTSVVSLNNEVPQNSIILNSNTLLPISVVKITSVLPEYSVGITSNTLLPTSSVTIDNIKPEFVLSVNSSTPIPSSIVALTAIGAGDYVTTISSNALLPTSAVELDTLAPVGISIASNTPLPFSEVTLDYENYSISVSSNALLPSGSVELDSTIPEYSADITSSTKLPTSVVFLVNGEVIKNINPRNIIKVQYRSNTVSAKQPNNITTPSHNNIIKLRN